MNTKTMRLPPRRALLPEKRKGPEDSTAAIKPQVRAATVTARKSTNSRHFKYASSEAAEPSPSNQLLAGYLANEFLNKRTLFGEPCESPRSQAIPASAPAPISKRRKMMSTPFAWKPEPSGRAADSKRRTYLEVSNLFRADGFQVPGIVNPAQLARFLNCEMRIAILVHVDIDNKSVIYQHDSPYT